MRNTTILILCFVAACHIPNVEALETHMRDECRVMPLGPSCAATHDDASRFVFARFAARNVTTAETERCLLDVDCSEERMLADANGALDELVSCLSDDPADRAARDGDVTCLSDCDSALSECGGGDTCGVDLVVSCFSDHDACVSACAP